MFSPRTDIFQNYELPTRFTDQTWIFSWGVDLKRTQKWLGIHIIFLNYYQQKHLTSKVGIITYRVNWHVIIIDGLYPSASSVSTSGAIKTSDKKGHFDISSSSISTWPAMKLASSAVASYCLVLNINQKGLIHIGERTWTMGLCYLTYYTTWNSIIYFSAHTIIDFFFTWE